MKLNKNGPDDLAPNQGLQEFQLTDITTDE